MALRLKNGHRTPADPCLRPELQARDVAIRRREYRCHRAVFVHRGPALAAPLRQSKLLDSIPWRLVHRVSLRFRWPRGTQCIEIHRRTPDSASHLLRANEKPPANLSAYRGFRESGDPFTCTRLVGLRPTTRRCVVASNAYRTNPHLRPRPICGSRPDGDIADQIDSSQVLGWSILANELMTVTLEYVLPFGCLDRRPDYLSSTSRGVTVARYS
jgi:hypothetical protein